MGDNFDLAAYIERIGYEGPLVPTHSTLREVHRLHAQALAFENLNPLLRLPIPLDSESLQNKMVHGRRGGYCFEQNLLLSHALRKIGFTVTGLAARVLLNRPPDSKPARTHMLLLVTAEGSDYVADAGFGSMTLTEPIKLQTDTVQPTSHESRRIVQVGDEFLMEARTREEWRTLYRFNLHPQALSDYEMANFYVANRPGSGFANGLTAARPTATGRYGLRNNELAIHDLEGNTDRSTLTTAAELRDALEDLFLIDVPDDPKLEGILQRLAAGESIDDAG